MSKDLSLPTLPGFRISSLSDCYVVELDRRIRWQHSLKSFVMTFLITFMFISWLLIVDIFLGYEKELILFTVVFVVFVSALIALISAFLKLVHPACVTVDPTMKRFVLGKGSNKNTRPENIVPFAEISTLKVDSSRILFRVSSIFASNGKKDVILWNSFQTEEEVKGLKNWLDSFWAAEGSKPSPSDNGSTR